MLQILYYKVFYSIYLPVLVIHSFTVWKWAGNGFFYPEGCWPKNCNSIWEKCPQGYDFLQRVSKEVSSKLGLVFWANFNICFMLVAGFELFYWCFCLWTPFCWVALSFDQWFLSKMFLLKILDMLKFIKIQGLQSRKHKNIDLWTIHKVRANF